MSGEIFHPSKTLSFASVTGASITAAASVSAGLLGYVTAFVIAVAPHPGATAGSFKVSTFGFNGGDFNIPVTFASVGIFPPITIPFASPLQSSTPGASFGLTTTAPASVGLSLTMLGFTAP